MFWDINGADTAMTCQPNPECKYFQEGCFQDRHHIYWPRHNYKDEIGATFRGLTENIVEICRVEHEQLHRQEPPEVPPVVSMAKAIIADQHPKYNSTRRKKLVENLLRKAGQ